MNTRRYIGLLAASSLALALLALPASAADSGSTEVSVQLTGGTLTIAADATSALATASVSPGTTTTNTADLLHTTVTDETGSLLGWTVTAVTDSTIGGGDLVGQTLVDTTGDGTADSTPVIDLGDTSLGSPLTMVAQTLTGSDLTDVSVGAGGGLNPTESITVAQALLGAGGGTYEYDDLITLTVPPNTYANTYTVTVVQTVS